MRLSRGFAWLVVFSVICSAAAVQADVRLPRVIGSHMVLQRDMPLTIWGWAAPGEEVKVTLGASQATAKTDEDGRWQVKLPAQKVGDAPLEMTIAGQNTIKLTDILVGEVWVGSGQSNMQWAVRQALNPDEEIAAGNHPNIRLFNIPLVPSGLPANDVNAVWTECNSNTVANFSAVLYFYGRHLHKELNVPVGLIATSWGGTRIEPWTPPVGFEAIPELKNELNTLNNLRNGYRDAVKAVLPRVRPWLEQAEKDVAAGKELRDPPPFPAHPLNSNGQPTGLYNGMIHPIVPFAIRGAIWYQGESNNGQAMHYASLMKGLIQGWRTVWNQGDFPFLYVQLAPYNYGANRTTDLPKIWEAQTAALKIPNTGMCVTTDIGNVSDIHPKNKQEVGRRLALWALAKTYGKEQPYSGPLYDSFEVELDQVRIKFKHAEGGLVARDQKPLTWFTIAGEDRKFVPAKVTISGETLLVSSPDVAKPVAVRFGWSQLAEPNLANQAGLPASPFRTDDWDDSTPQFPGEKK